MSIWRKGQRVRLSSHYGRLERKGPRISVVVENGAVGTVVDSDAPGRAGTLVRFDADPGLNGIDVAVPVHWLAAATPTREVPT